MLDDLCSHKNQNILLHRETEIRTNAQEAQKKRKKKNLYSFIGTLTCNWKLTMFCVIAFKSVMKTKILWHYFHTHYTSYTSHDTVVSKFIWRANLLLYWVQISQVPQSKFSLEIISTPPPTLVEKPNLTKKCPQLYLASCQKIPYHRRNAASLLWLAIPWKNVLTSYILESYELRHL